MDITARKLNELKTLKDSLYDPSSHLPNRQLFRDRLENTIQRALIMEGYEYAVLMLRLDGTETFDDKFGSEIFDWIAHESGITIQNKIRPSDSLSRVRENEFLILLDPVRSIKEATDIARYIHKALLAPLQFNDNEIYLTSSMGIAFGSNGYGNAESIIRDATVALNRAKLLGGNRLEVFDEQTNARASALLRMDNDLKSALANDELQLYYQPIISAKDCQCAGLESLLVWHHPRRGMLFSEVVYGIAQDLNTLLPVKQRMLNKLCENATAWQELPTHHKHIHINIQICGKAMLDGYFLSQMGKRLPELSSEKFSFALEISDTIFSEITEEQQKTLIMLHDQGIHLVLDVCGSGSLSMLNLLKVPIDTLKLNKSFVQAGATERRLLESIIHFAHSMNMTVIADGVDSRQLLEELRVARCDYLQGRSVQPPISYVETGKFLARVKKPLPRLGITDSNPAE